MKKEFLILLLMSLFLGFVSCDDKDDIIPGGDDTEEPEDYSPIFIEGLDSIINIAYPRANYGLICELASDNLFDNRVPYFEGGTSPITEMRDPMYEPLYTWQDVPPGSKSDSPYNLWEGYYNSITEANRIIYHVDKMKKTEDYKPEMATYKGEALILRAYCHYILNNIFGQAYRDANLSASDMSIPYYTSIDSMTTDYKILSVSEIYNKIEKDLEEGIELLKNDKLDKTIYRFNLNSAYALAAKVHLNLRNYQKVIDYANMVLGADPTNILRDWKTSYTGPEAQREAYMDINNPANLFLLDTYSLQIRSIMNKPCYGYNRDALKGSYKSSGPTWGARCRFLDGWEWIYSNCLNYSGFLGYLTELFEYTDEEASIGYAHILRAELTTDGLLLDRAEAQAMLRNTAEALEDLYLWNSSHLGQWGLTDEMLTKFYTSETAQENCYSFPFNSDKMSPNFNVSPEVKPYIDCVLHFRRLERVHFGDRWFDLKRYGIEITKKIGEDAQEITLAWDSPQRALKIPQKDEAQESKANPATKPMEVGSVSQANIQ